MANKNPWVAAILNFFIWGLGYLYVGKGKRTMFAIGLVIASIIAASTYYLVEAPILAKLSIEDMATFDLSYLFLGMIVGIVFAWDAFKDAKEAEIKSRKPY